MKSRGLTLLSTGLLAFTVGAVAHAGGIVLTPIGLYETNVFAAGGAEIVTYDPGSKTMALVSAAANEVHLVDLSDPTAPRRLRVVDFDLLGGAVNSVAAHQGRLVAAVQAVDPQAPGKVVFFDTDGGVVSSVTVGALPDMVTFSPDGKWVVVANEGEPKDYCVAGLANDPVGSVSVIDATGGADGVVGQNDVRTAGFGGLVAPAGVRVFGPGATLAQDLEPEYVAVSPDSTRAWVSLQESNALAAVDLATATVTALLPLGLKDHSLAWNALDPSDRDAQAAIRVWPVMGMYQPDTIAAYTVGGETYLALANEGDARDYECFGEEERIGDLALDPVVFPDAAGLQQDAALGRLRTTSAGTDTDGDGDADVLLAYGSRSLSIRRAADGALVWDSGAQLELLEQALGGGLFNANHEANDSFDSRSDDKGPEPEALALGVFRGRTYAFVGLERSSSLYVFDVSDPQRPFFVTRASTRDPAGDPEAFTAGDLGPEGIHFVPFDQSPIRRALLLVANEISGTVRVYSVKPAPAG